LGRTGRLFAMEHFGVVPDLVVMAKALGGGFPVGACLATERAAQGMKAGSHGSTFGGNPLAMHLGNAVLDVMLEPRFLEQVRRVSGYFHGKLEGLVAKHPGVYVEVRGKGLLTGLRCEVPNTEVSDKLRAAGMLTVTAGENVIRLLPPLIAEERHIDEAIGILDGVARDWKR